MILLSSLANSVDLKKAKSSSEMKVQSLNLTSGSELNLLPMD